MAFKTIKNGSKGDLVKLIQVIFELNADGIFGPKTLAAVKAFQKEKKLSVDGIVGPKTWEAIASSAPTLRSGAKNKWVVALEMLLQTLTADGEYKQDELAHVKTYQTTNKLTVDGIVGPKTWGRLFETTSLSVPGSTCSNNKRPTDYKQYDSRWGKIVYTKNNTYNKSQTISSGGCGPTSVADIISFWCDKSITPKETAALAVANGYRTENNGTSAGFFKFCYNKFKDVGIGFSKYLTTTSYATAESAIKDGALVIANVGPGVWTKGGHYICWYDVDDTYVYINDPASAAANRAKSEKSNLKKQTKGYYIFYKKN